MTRQSPQLLPIALLAGAAYLLLTWPIWRWLWGEWMGNDYYSHGILIVPVALFLSVQRFRNDPELSWPPQQGSTSGLALMILSLALYLYFLNQKAYYLAAFATLGLLGGLLWTLAGTRIARKLAFAVGFLALAIPLPFIERSTLPLAMFTGVCAGGLVQILGFDIVIVGNAVTLPNADLVIGAQCSGINSLMALLSLTVLAAYLLQGPWWGRLTMIALAVPLALLGNILRVASLLVVARGYGADAAFIFYHDYSGPVFFLVALALLLPLSQLLRCRTLRLEVI